MGRYAPASCAVKQHLVLFRRHALDDADEQREDDAADGASRNIADPALDGLPGHRANQLSDNAAADRAGDRITECPQRILLGSRPRRAGP